MTQKQKQRATWNQINQIERAVRLLDSMLVSGLYLDSKQERKLINISHFTKRLTSAPL
mgnify:CR=1 FL=1